MFVFTLHPGREKSLLRRHPWIFSKAINPDKLYELTSEQLATLQAAAASTQASTAAGTDAAAIEPEAQTSTLDLTTLKAALSQKIPAGELCMVVADSGQFLCYAHYSPKSQIRLRAISFKLQNKLDYAWLKQRLTAAFNKRKLNELRGDKGMRLVAAEGDYLPGLIVDQYNHVISMALSSWGMEALYSDLVTAIHELKPEFCLYERSDSKSRAKEDLPLRCGLVDPQDPSPKNNLKQHNGQPQPHSRQVDKVMYQGELKSLDECIPDTLYVMERGLVEIPIDVKAGHKTGGYLDQRQSRYRTYEICKELKALSADGKTGPQVLNCFAYTGGFGLFALKGGAKSVFNVDVSEHALQAAKQGVVHNHLDPGRCKFIKQDVFAYLRQEVAKGTQFDLVILDPPKFAEGKSSLATACRGYQDINRLGMQLVRPGGRLLTFSCSGLMTEDLFQKIIADAALDAKVEAQIVGTLRQDIDHLVSLPCPESFYLKGFEILIN